MIPFDIVVALDAEANQPSQSIAEFCVRLRKQLHAIEVAFPNPQAEMREMAGLAVAALVQHGCPKRGQNDPQEWGLTAVVASVPPEMREQAEAQLTTYRRDKALRDAAERLTQGGFAVDADQLAAFLERK